LSLAGSLEKEGYDVSIIDGEVHLLTADQITKQTLEYQPSFVGITSTTPEYHVALKVAQDVKKHDKNITVVMGGAHVSALPEESLKEANGSIDHVVVGEGEYAIVDVVKRQTNEKILRYPEIKDLNTLPTPAKHLLDYSYYRYAHPQKGLIKTDAIETSRGCPFQCTFCFKLHGSKVRFKDPMRVVDEIEKSHTQLGTQMFIFFDDTFTLKRERAVKICNEILRRDLKLSFFCFTRADTLDRELILLMKKTGFDKVTLGIESGNQEILKRIKKGTKLEDYEEKYNLMYEAGIETRGSFIVGNPGETRETVEDSIRFAKKLPLFRAGVNILTPYPGTSLYRDALEGKNGLKLVCKDWRDFTRWGTSVVETPDLTKDDLERYQKRFLREFYSSRKVILYHLKEFLFKANHSFYYYRPVLE